MAPRKPAAAETGSYHHGDLRRALIRAAVEELEERGIEQFTLRSCARRAGVSHAAPAHHFGDVTGLLSAVAAEAYERLAASMRRQVEKAEPGSIEHPVAAALGYVLFAIESPGEFQLMFRRERLNADDPALRATAAQSFGLAAGAVAAYLPASDPADPVLSRRVVGLWALAHGVASLFIAGQLGSLSRAKRLAQAMLPDMVREHFGLPPVNDDADLALIQRTAQAQTVSPPK
jgi:AcrR family transcriptional regulator